LTYRWDFGDGSATVDGASVTHDFAVNGEFEIWMTVFDGAEDLFRHVTTLTRGTGNQTPVLDLDTLTDGNDALARICPLEQEASLLRRARLLLADSDSRTLAQVTLQLADPVAGEGELLLPPEALPEGVSTSYNAVDAILTLTGPASPGIFADVLAGVRYYNATAVPVADDRSIGVVADDGKAQVQRTITVQTRDQLRLQVQPGWALYSVPLTPVQADIGTVFGDGQRALLVRDLVFAWNPQRLRYWPIQNAQSQQGVWAFSEAEEETETNESAGFCARNDLNLLRGWNLWGPAEEVSVAELLLAQPGLAAVWEWDPIAHNYQRLEANDILERGKAYWLFMDAP
ncbi:MAG: PKD domain-containing protein, partial [Victivallales bacterium]|nr:PKD domain-containing protein [Victivallales bacterium]